MLVQPTTRIPFPATQPKKRAHNGIWKDIWTFRVQNKIKHFFFVKLRLLKTNLFKWKVSRNATCDCCQNEVEDTVHALWGCQVLKEIWWEDASWRNNLYDYFVNFIDLLTGILHYQVPDSVKHCAYIARSIWNKCNASNSLLWNVSEM